MKKISIIGTGYVGLVTGVSLAALGNSVVCVGRQESKAKDINHGKSPYYEPGLDSLIKDMVKKKRLTATTDFDMAVANSDITILAVGTPTINNKIDLTAIKEATRQIANVLKNKKIYHVVAVKSTVVPGATENIVKPLLPSGVGLCMNPEFLREGNAVEDALHPDRIVIGQLNEKSGRVFSEIYKKNTCPKIFTSLKTAELIKYTSNALFAALISFSNEIARISQKTGVDVVNVWDAVHLDNRLAPVVNGKRIRPGFISYLYSGPGFGGSCFPKDTKAFRAYAQSIGENAPVIDSVIKINDSQPLQTIALLQKELKSLKGKKIAVLGFSFKPDTDDIRESPALTIISELIRLKAHVIAHDPVAKLPDGTIFKQVTVAPSVSKALEKADGVIVVTSWQDYKKLTPDDFKSKMKQAIVVDARRIYDKNTFVKAGIRYSGIGYENEN